MTWNEIADYYGLEAQAEQLVEEMAELTVALSKLRRAGYDSLSAAWENTVEEIADVGVMIGQLAYLLHAEQAVNRIQEEKLARQTRRIQQEERFTQVRADALQIYFSPDYEDDDTEE